MKRLADLKIEVPESADVWASLSHRQKEEIALFAYLEDMSVGQWLKEAIESSIEGDESLHFYDRKEEDQASEIPA